DPPALQGRLQAEAHGVPALAQLAVERRLKLPVRLSEPLLDRCLAVGALRECQEAGSFGTCVELADDGVQLCRAARRADADLEVDLSFHQFALGSGIMPMAVAFLPRSSVTVTRR